MDAETPKYPGKGYAISQMFKTAAPNGRFDRIKENNKGIDVTSQILPSQEQIDQRIKKFIEPLKLLIDKSMKDYVKDKRIVPRDNTNVNHTPPTNVSPRGGPRYKRSN